MWHGEITPPNFILQAIAKILVEDYSLLDTCAWWYVAFHSVTYVVQCGQILPKGGPIPPKIEQISPGLYTEISTYASGITLIPIQTWTSYTHILLLYWSPQYLVYHQPLQCLFATSVHKGMERGNESKVLLCFPILTYPVNIDNRHWFLFTTRRVILNMLSWIIKLYNVWNIMVHYLMGTSYW